MRKTSSVVAVITLTCGLVAAGTVLAQFGPIGTQGSRPRGDYRPRTGEQDPRGAGETQAVVKGETPAAWEAVRKFRTTGKPAMLGITINDRDEGVAVLRVSSGGTAEENGIETGDLIVAVDGVGLTESDRRSPRSPTETLLAQMGAVNLGDTVTLTVRRGDDEQDIEMVIRALGPDSYFVL